MNNYKHKSRENTKAIKLLLVVCILFCSSLLSLAQNPLYFRLKLSIEKGNLDNTKVTVSKNGVQYKTIDSKSKYDLELETGAEYILTATKKGYVTKSLLIDTKVPFGRDEEDFAGYESEITLVPQPEDEEITYTQPVGKISFDAETNDFNDDKNYNAQSRIKQKQAEAEPRKKPKPPADSIKSKPIEIVKKPLLTVGENKPIPKVKIPDPPVVPVNRTVVETTTQQDKLKITYRAVTINGVEIIYRKEEFSWGGVYFYKGAKNITENTFENDTK